MNKLLVYSFIILICAMMMYFYFIKTKVKEIKQDIPNAVNIILFDNSKIKYYDMTKNALKKHKNILIIEWDYEKCLIFLKKLPIQYIETFESLNIFKDKIFFISLCILYTHGGWVVDNGVDTISENIFYILDKQKNKNFVFFTNSNKIKKTILGSPAGNIIIKQTLNDIINSTKYKEYYYISSMLNYLDFDDMHGYHTQHNNDTVIVTNNNVKIASLNAEWLVLKKKEKHLDTQLIKKLNYYSDINIKKKKIPKILHITGPANVPNEVIVKFKNIISVNRDFKILYYDDIDSRNIIKSNFDYKYLNFYDRLKPTAYKADFFRYSVMYLHGGVYGDMSQEYYRNLKDLVNFNLDDMVLCDDLMSNIHHKKGIQISFLASIPGLSIYKILIDKICDNIDNSYYGKTPLDITGPILFREILDITDLNYIINLKQISNNDIVDKNNIKVISRKNQNHNNILYKNSKHYSVIWSEKNVYKKYQTHYLNVNGILEFCNTTYTPNYSTLNNLDIVAVNVYDIKSLLLYLEKYKINIVVFIHNKTGKCISKHIIELLDNNYIIRVYCTNYFSGGIHEKLKIVPVGINYNDSYNAYLFENEHHQTVDYKINKTLSCFNLSKTFLHSVDNQNVYMELQSNKFNDFLSREAEADKVNEIKKYKYIICPNASSDYVDIHSVYKIIALGSTPVVLKSPLDIIYKKIKVIRLKSWKDVSLEILDKKYNKMQQKSNDIITMKYWKTLLFEDITPNKKIKEYNINNI